MSLSQVNKLNDHFKFPIYFNDKKQPIAENISNDLELIKTIDSDVSPIYNYFFNNTNDLSKQITKQVAQYYTIDKQFLKDNQQLLKTYTKPNKRYANISPDYSKFITIWDEIKNDNGFKEKYYYINWSSWDFLNKSESFLQVMSVYNIASPLVSLLIPIIILIIPFFIIRIKGHQLTVTEYLDVLKVIVSNHAIGKLFTQFNSVSAQQKLYLLLSAGFYVFSIYQNAHVCMRYNTNMKQIHRHLADVHEYIDHTVLSMNNYISASANLTTHTKFNDNLREKIRTLVEFRDTVSKITKYEITNYKKAVEIGRVLKLFYELYDDAKLNDAIMYSLGFNGYIDCIEGLIDNISNKKINFTSFVKNSTKSAFKNSYYACLKDGEPVKNTVRFKKNIIITGPNASGKTTILKSTLINVIVSQQFGCGFYDSAKLKPFKYIHCYLNIPDTSGRDSLFQAEARRCKEILDVISDNKKDGHFCVFDELYSGTNPEEAITSASAFMEYMVKNRGVYCMLTTHFVDICNKLNDNLAIENCNMLANKDGNRLRYTYKLTPGISTVKGGVNILADMDYPDEIIQRASIMDFFQ